MKAMPSEERVIILQCCLMVLRFMFQEFQVSFQFRKTTEDIWSGCSFGQSQYPADAGHWNQPIAAMDQAGTCSKAQLFCIYCFQLYTSGLSCKWILMSHSNKMFEETGFIVDGISVNLEQRGTRALHSHICQREFLNTKRRNFADEQL